MIQTHINRLHLWYVIQNYFVYNMAKPKPASTTPYLTSHNISPTIWDGLQVKPFRRYYVQFISLGKNYTSESLHTFRPWLAPSLHIVCSNRSTNPHRKKSRYLATLSPTKAGIRYLVSCIYKCVGASQKYHPQQEKAKSSYDVWV